MFDYKNSKFEKIELMRRKTVTSEKYEDVIRYIGAPNNTLTENDRVLIGHKWTTINHRYYIETELTVPHHLHQHYSEGIGGNFELAIIKLYHNTPYVPTSYWCYAARFLDKARRYLSKPSLDGRSGYKIIKGETGDISIFRFSWFELIWFYSPATSFPQDKMFPGFF